MGTLRPPHRRIALARAESLPAPARAALETAAALGNEVPYRLWAMITDLPPVALAQAGFTAVGEQLGVGVAANALGLVTERQGDLTAAETYYREALTIAETAVAPSFIAFAQQDLGRLYLQMNDAAQAIPLLESASKTWQANEDTLNYLRCQASLGLAHLAMGESAPAETIAEAG